MGLRLTIANRVGLTLCARLVCSALLGLVGSSGVAQSPSYEELRAGFAHPPAEARLRCYWWWLNGHTDKPTITHDLEEMKAKGFGGALLVDADGSGQGGNREVTPGPTFASAAWTELYVHALKEADRLGLEITLNINSGWNLGGPGVVPEESSKLLTWTWTAVQGGTPVSVPLAAPVAKNGFYRQIAVLAYPATAKQPVGLPGLRQRSAAVETGFSMPDSGWMLSATGTPAGGTGLNQATENDLKQGAFSEPASAPNSATEAKADAEVSEVLDIASRVAADGTLTWTPPPGAWQVLRIGYTDSDARVSTSSGAWQGRALDHLSRTAFDSYWDRVVEPLLAAAKPFHSLRYLATDSWELGGTNWTEGFAAEFKARRGYDPVPWLPVVAGRIVTSPDASARFLTDLRRTVADLVVANHYDRFAERAAAHGLGVQAESGGPHGAPIDALETYRHAAVPQTEFWSQNPHRSTDEQRFFPKQAASAAHIYGQRFVAAEGETSINEQWSESLATDLKPSFDMAITEGMNRLVWHEFTSSPADTGVPGQEYFAGTHLNPKVTWWNAGGAFFDYLNRVQFLMQQGVAVDDVLYFYGDNVPAFVRLKADDPARVLPGYDYDVTDEDALLRTIGVTGKTLTGPGGVVWRALVLPRTRRLSPEALGFVERYVRGGGAVAGLPPTGASGQLSPEGLTRFQAQVQAIWASCRPGTSHAYGQGRVSCEDGGRAVLAELGVVPDVRLTTAAQGPAASSSGGIDYVHRRVGETEVYFLRNGAAQPVHAEAEFRVLARHAEAWDAVTGEVVRLAPRPSGSPGTTRLSLDLPAFGSLFVVFRPGAAASLPVVPSAHAAEEIHSLRPWTLVFEPNRGGPLEAATLPALTSWTESADPRVRFFSGTAMYRTAVDGPKAAAHQAVYLEFSEVREIARVRINGKDAGTVWAKPYRLRVDSLLRPGANELEVEVTNLWPNRIIGDLQPGASAPITQTNITAYRADSPLLPSGLIGPLHWELPEMPASPR